MFLGRKPEMASLEHRYAAGSFEFIVLYGRRRVGKTELINQFLRGKPGIFLSALEGNAELNLGTLCETIQELDPSILSGVFAPTWQNVLGRLFQYSCSHQLILAIDEYPNLARSCPSLASTLQVLIDQHQKSSHLFLILCGSAVTYMEDEVMAYTAALHGRLTGRIRLEPLHFEEVNTWCRPLSPVDRACMYGIIGGVPQYLLQVRPSETVEENVKRIFLDRTSLLHEEPGTILRQEVREAAKYGRVLTAIASGASQATKIAEKAGLDPPLCSQYLKTLMELDIVRRETPFGNEKSRKPVYQICDNMFRFWYRFIPRVESLIQRGFAASAWNRIAPCLSEYMGPVFEEICREYLWKLVELGQSPVDLIKLGSWWGNDPAARSQAEIDIAGDDGDGTGLFGECKWTSAEVDRSVLETLVHRSSLVPHPRNHFFLFSKTGFTNGCRERAEAMGNVSLVTLDDMIRTFDLQ